MELNEKEIEEMKRMKAFFPFRKVAAVKLTTGEFQIFAASTMAKANNFARKNNGLLFVIGG